MSVVLPVRRDNQMSIKLKIVIEIKTLVGKLNRLDKANPSQRKDLWGTY